MELVQNFTKYIEDADIKHKLFIKKEEDRYKLEIKEINEKFLKMIDYNKCVDMFIDWFKIMVEVCTQYNDYGYSISLPRIVPGEIIKKLKNLKLSIKYIIDGNEISTPHHWTVSIDKYPLLKIKPELELFCKIHMCEIYISNNPEKVIWGN